jgi:hypothetical protein
MLFGQSCVLRWMRCCCAGIGGGVTPHGGHSVEYRADLASRLTM